MTKHIAHKINKCEHIKRSPNGTKTKLCKTCKVRLSIKGLIAVHFCLKTYFVSANQLFPFCFKLSSCDLVKYLGHIVNCLMRLRELWRTSCSGECYFAGFPSQNLVVLLPGHKEILQVHNWLFIFLRHFRGCSCKLCVKSFVASNCFIHRIFPDAE